MQPFLQLVSQTRFWKGQTCYHITSPSSFTAQIQLSVRRVIRTGVSINVLLSQQSPWPKDGRDALIHRPHYSLWQLPFSSDSLVSLQIHPQRSSISIPSSIFPTPFSNHQQSHSCTLLSHPREIRSLCPGDFPSDTRQVLDHFYP